MEGFPKVGGNGDGCAKHCYFLGTFSLMQQIITLPLGLFFFFSQLQITLAMFGFNSRRHSKTKFDVESTNFIC